MRKKNKERKKETTKTRQSFNYDIIGIREKILTETNLMIPRKITNDDRSELDVTDDSLAFGRRV